MTSFTSSEILFENICDFIISKNIEIQNLSTFEFIDLYISEFTNDKSISSKHLIKFFFEVNKHLEQSNHYSITKSNLKAIAKDTFGFDLKIELLSPIIVSYHHWYKLSSIYFEWYFIAKKLSITQNQELYKQELQDSVLDNCYDITILDFIESANKSKLWEWFINPELDRLLKAIDFTDDKSIILSFINFFQIEFDLSWNKKEKTLEINGSSNSEYHYENIFQWMGIEFYISDFENYFEVGMHANETCERLCMDINMQKDIYNVVTKTIPAKIVNSFITNKEETIFEIKLLDFITSLDNYNLMEKVGLVKYIKQIVKKIINVQLANNYKFSSTTVFL